MKNPEEEKESNVYYQCQRCGNCCRWQGDVRITEKETVMIADYLGMEVEDFIADYTRLNANRTGLSIIDQEDGACFSRRNRLPDSGSEAQPVQRIPQ